MAKSKPQVPSSEDESPSPPPAFPDVAALMATLAGALAQQQPKPPKPLKAEAKKAERVEAMRKATGFDYKTEVIGRRRGDVPNLTADPTLAEKELGFKAPQSLETMCRDLWNWQSKNPNGYADAAEKEAQQ